MMKFPSVIRALVCSIIYENRGWSVISIVGVWGISETLYRSIALIAGGLMCILEILYRSMLLTGGLVFTTDCCITNHIATMIVSNMNGYRHHRHGGMGFWCGGIGFLDGALYCGHSLELLLW